MNKKPWNTIILDGSIPQGELERMMDNSYLLVDQERSGVDNSTYLVTRPLGAEGVLANSNVRFKLIATCRASL